MCRSVSSWGRDGQLQTQDCIGTINRVLGSMSGHRETASIWGADLENLPEHEQGASTRPDCVTDMDTGTDDVT